MHQTKVRPPTEPYEIWCARRKLQQKELKEYLKGRVIWRSNILVDKRPPHRRFSPPRKPIRKKLISKDLKSVPLLGTYVAPVCFLCEKKEKRCECWKKANGDTDE
jgi:hypothetical protein